MQASAMQMKAMSIWGWAHNFLLYRIVVATKRRPKTETTNNTAKIARKY
jgi:hypothetical protein